MNNQNYRKEYLRLLPSFLKFYENDINKFNSFASSAEISEDLLMNLFQESLEIVAKNYPEFYNNMNIQNQNKKNMYIQDYISNKNENTLEFQNISDDSESENESVEVSEESEFSENSFSEESSEGSAEEYFE